ncbi:MULTISPECIES: RNase P modulator RnpM [Gracilibacillus]|uniref:RNase P modulator RnpM n=1 Tax=Gracilibacillus TaxID=74385 RepID=UPI00082720B5|nr:MULTISPECIES: YlxR family protein [Gracilibacillus]
MTKKRKVPLRKCVVTQEMFPKKDLIRVVKTKDGEVFVDTTGKKNGRGAYISKHLETVVKAEQTGVLAKQLEIEIPDEIYEQLRQAMAGE